MNRTMDSTESEWGVIFKFLQRKRVAQSFLSTISRVHTRQATSIESANNGGTFFILSFVHFDWIWLDSVRSTMMAEREEDHLMTPVAGPTQTITTHTVTNAPAPTCRLVRPAKHSSPPALLTLDPLLLLLVCPHCFVCCRQQ